MQTKSVQPSISQQLGLPLCSLILSLGSSSVSAANAMDPDRMAMRLDAINARVERKTDRIEARNLRLDMRNGGAIASGSSGGAFVPSIVPASGASSNPSLGFDISVQNNRGGRNTLPGQLSEFRTTRPEAVNRSTFTNDDGRTRSLRQGVSLDLSSSAANITVGSKLLGESSVSIKVGDRTKVIKAGDQVTAAEYAALNQQLTSGSQGLNLSLNGTAIDGTLNLDNVSDNGRSITTTEFVIPSNVTVSGDFSRHSDGVRVTNELVNYGSIYAVSSNHKDTAIVGARDVTNADGAVISSFAPIAVREQFDSPNAVTNLSLRASRNFDNAGEISSSGTLDIKAGNELNNSGTMTGAGGVSLNMPTLNNSGAVIAQNGSISLSSPVDSNLTVNADGGQFSAANGDINIATVPGVNIKPNTTLTGGDWYAKHMNITSGDGTVQANIGEVTATVNTTAGIINFNADTEVLNIGYTLASGDPLFSSPGALNFSGPVTTNGGPLTAVAGGNITSTNAPFLISTSNGAGAAAGNILFVAGANFDIVSNVLTIHDGASVTGGSIAMSTVSFEAGIASSSTAGNITLLAQQAPSTATGGIYVSGISANGANGGNVLIAAGSVGGGGIDTINTGAINVSGSTSAGTIRIVTSQFTTSDVTIDAAAGPSQGAVLSGTFNVSAPVASSEANVSINGSMVADGANASINVNVSGNFHSQLISMFPASQSSSTGAINVNAVGGIAITSINARGANRGGISITSSSDGEPVYVGPVTYNGANAGSLTIQNTGTAPISLNGVYDTRGTNAGGDITVSSAGEIHLLSDSSFLTSSPTAGNVSLISAGGIKASTTAGLTIDTTFLSGAGVGSGNIDINSDVSTGGGSIVLNTGTNAVLSGLFSTGGSTSAGSINISATEGFINGINVTLDTRPTTSGDSGSVTAVSLIQTVFSEINASSIGGGNPGSIGLNGLQAGVLVSGTISGGATSISTSSGTAPRTYNTAVTSLTLSLPNRAVTINEADDISLGAVTAAELNLTSAAGSITTTGTITTPALTLTTNSDANINLNSNINIGSGTIKLFAANNGDITQDVSTRISGNSASQVEIYLNGTTPGTAVLNSPTNAVGKLFGSGGGDIEFFNNAALGITGVGATQNLTATSTSASGISFINDQTTTGTLSLYAQRLNVGSANITAASILVSNASGNIQVVGSGGSLNGTTPAAGPPGGPSNPAAINFVTGVGAALDLSGTLNFSGDVYMDNTGGTTTVAAGAAVIGSNNIVLRTSTYQPLGQLIANDFLMDLGTLGAIINTEGDVNISATTRVFGKDLAILATGSININNGVIISTAGGAGGGDLFIAAGWNFTPSSGGQIETDSTYTFETSVAGSNVNASGVNFVSDSLGAGTAGNITIAATGTLTVGEVSAVGTNGGGGKIALYAGSGITAGNLNSSGSTGGGAIDVSTGAPTITGSVTAGAFTGTVSGGAGSGTVSLGSITTASTPVTIKGSTVQTEFITIGSNNGAGSLAITATDSITTNALAIPLGTLNLSAVNGINIAALGGSSANLTMSADTITLGSVNAPGSTSSITAGSTLSLNGGFTAGPSITINAPTITLTGFSTLAAGTDLSGNGGTLLINTSNRIQNDQNQATKLEAVGTTGNGGSVSIYDNSPSTVQIGPHVIFDVHGALSGGRISVRTDGSISVASSGLIYEGANGDGADISLVAIANGTISLQDGQAFAQLSATSANGDGGSLDLRAFQIFTPVGMTQPVFVSANGAGSGDGGEISIKSQGIQPIFIGQPTKPPKSDIAPLILELSARGGDQGDGGKIYIEQSSSITAKVTSMNASAGSTGNNNGASYGLIARSGALLVDGGLNAAGSGNGSSGDIELVSNSDKTFTFGSSKKAKNGIAGALTVGVGGDLRVTNLAGGITSNQSITADLVRLQASGKGAIAFGKGTVVTADEIRFVSNTGAIGKKAIAINTSNLDLTSQGQVNLFNSNATLTLENSTVGGLNLTTNGVIHIDGVAASDGDVFISGGSGGELNVSAPITATNGAITLVNPDTVNGVITIYDNVITSGDKGGEVKIAIGEVPKKGVNTQPPSGFTVTNEGKKGIAYFDGPNGSIIGGSIFDAEVAARNKPVFISNQSATGKTITVGGGVVIVADPPSKASTLRATANSLLRMNGMSEGGSRVKDGQLDMPTDLLEVSHVSVLNSVLTNTSVPRQSTSTLSSSSVTSLDALAGGNTVLAPIAAHSETWEPAPDAGTVGGANGLFVSAAFQGLDSSDMESFKPNLVNGVSLSEVTENAVAKFISLESGNVVFAPTADTIVETRHGTVSIAAKSVVVVAQTDTELSVFNIDDHRRDAVVVIANDKRLSLTPGLHVTITSRDSARFADSNQVELVQHRDLERTKLQNGWNVFTSEFSIPSACYAVEPLRHLVSSNHKSLAKVKTHMMKTAAVVLSIRPDRGDYVQHFKSQMTAMK